MRNDDVCCALFVDQLLRRIETIDKLTTTMQPSPIALAVSTLMEEFLSAQKSNPTRPSPRAIAPPPLTASLGDVNVVNVLDPSIDDDMDMIVKTAVLKMVHIFSFYIFYS